MIQPPLNYTGSKFKLLDQILPELNYKKEKFVDLFAGGGSVYANVLDKYEEIIVNDIMNYTTTKDSCVSDIMINI